MTSVLLVAAVVGSGILAGGMFLFAVGVNPGLTSTTPAVLVASGAAVA